MEKLGSSNWCWMSCNLPLKCQIGSNVTTWPLRPEIALAHPKRNDIDPIVNFVVDMEKSFQFSEDLGWNWHKSWNIPTLTIQMDISDPVTKEKLLCPAEFKAHMFAVKAVLNQDNKINLIDIGLHGVSKMDILDGKAQLQALKFASTSFNNEGVKFHIIICIYLQITEDSKPKVMKALISPPIFVDSRKGIRESDKGMENRLTIYAEPFYPDSFSKKFVRKEAKKRDIPAEGIQNTVEGLYLYLTASNIRNKIRHPVFLSVRFSNCVSLHYNPKKLNKEEVQNIACTLQSLMHEDLMSRMAPIEVNIEETSFVMLIEAESMDDKNKKKKFWELLTPVKHRSLTIVTEKKEIPSYFIALENLKEISDMYSKSYPKLAASSKDLFREDEVDEDEFSSEKLPPPETQTISCREESSTVNESQWKRYLSLPEYEGGPLKKVKEEEISSLKSNDIISQQSLYRKDTGSGLPHRSGAEDGKRSSLFTSGMVLEKTPIMRQHQAINMNNPLIYNSYHNQLAPVNVNMMGNGTQFSNLVSSTQNTSTPVAVQGYYPTYPRQMGVNLNPYNNVGVDGAQNTHQKVSANVDINSVSKIYNTTQNANVYIPMQYYGYQQNNIELKEEDKPNYIGFGVKSEANVKEEECEEDISN